MSSFSVLHSMARLAISLFSHLAMNTITIADLANEAKRRLMAPRIVKLELIITEGCNLGCTYCFEYAADHRKQMSLSTALNATDFLFEASRTSPHVGITFMGGEPLLQFSLICSVIGHARESAARKGKSVSFDMQTNGLLIDEHHARYFRDAGLRYCLSLDGARSTNDRYRRTLGGGGSFDVIAGKMKLLKRFQHWQGVRMTVMPTEASALASNVRMLHEELSINQFIIGFATHVDWQDHDIADYANGLKNTFDYFFEQCVERGSRRLRISLFELGELSEAYAGKREGAW